MLLDGFLGALLGALITGAAQIWSFQQGRKDVRAGQSLNAARELLAVVYQSIQALRAASVYRQCNRIAAVLPRTP